MIRSRNLVTAVTAGLLFAGAAYGQKHFLHEFETLKLSDEFYGEGATAGDYNRDGKLDVASGPYWYAGPDFKKRRAFYPPKPFDPHGYSDNFFSFTDDFNEDGWDDILVYGFPGKDASWFENPRGVDRPWTRHKVLDVVDNESPMYVDITGDSRRDIVCSVGGYFGFAEVPRTDADQPWEFHRVSENTAGGRFTHGLGIGDVNGDGRMDVLEKTGWWEQPESLDGDPVWRKHPMQFSGPGGAQMYAYDFDGDGDNDVLTSLAAHGYGLAWYENKAADDGAIQWTQHQIMGATAEENRYGVRFSQLHAIDLADIDGDGIKDIVTGKRYWAHGPKGDAEPGAPAVVYWFRTVRHEKGVDFVPYEVDNNSGVGTEVDSVDINGDGQLDIIVGNKKGTFVHIQSRKEVSADQWKKAQPMPRDAAAKASRPGLAEHAGLRPAEAADAMTVPEGFHVRLIAGEPRVHQPVAMAIDARGRLWVAEAHTYPVRAPDGEGKDKIIILEDSDGDGAFETRKVFIDGLNLVSGLEVGFGGVWVGAAPYLLFIPDGDGDDVPDSEPQVLLDGFGYQDTHETLNAFIWGPDGWLYGCHGVFTHSKVGKPGTAAEQRIPMNAGVWRYHPTRHEFEVFAWGTSNPWGVDFDDHGQAFITACVIPHLYHMIQGGRYQRQGGQHFRPHIYDDIKTIADHAHYAGNIRDHAWWGRDSAVAHDTTDAAGGGHAHCGAMIYLGDNWPDRYRNTLFMSNIHGNRFNNDILHRNGSGFVGSHGHDFLFANDKWFRGINLKYGPDGGVYIIDWYDKNACHRRTPEIWDRTNGRIFKVTFGKPKSETVDLRQLEDEELVQLANHPNEWFVRMSRRILQHRMTASAESTLQRRQAISRAIEEHVNLADPARRLRAMWLNHVAGAPDAGSTNRALLDHDNQYVRAWAIQLDLENRRPWDGMSEKLAEMARVDPSPVVRLYIAAALQRLPRNEAWWEIAKQLAGHGDDATDHNLPLMIWYGIEPAVVEAPKAALAIAASSKIELVSRYIYRRAAADAKALDEVLLTLKGIDRLDRQRMILEEVSNMVRSRANLAMPAFWPEVYQQLANSDDAAIRQHVQFITVKFGDRSIFPALRTIVGDTGADAGARRQALAALVAGKDKQLPPLLRQLLDDDPFRGLALRALAGFEDAETPLAVISRYDDFNDGQRSDAIATLASRRSYAQALLDAIGKGTIPREDLTAYHVRQIVGFEDDALNARLNKEWGAIRVTPEEKLRQIDEFKKRLTPELLADADLPSGRAVFKKTCAKCHRLFGDGGDIGPDITGSNRGNLTYILENVLDPSAVVGRNYQMTMLELDDGRVVSGLIKEENESAVSLQTVNDLLVVPVDEIAQRKQSPLSLMPDGQLTQMTPAEARDLIAYLATPSQVPLPGEGPFFDEKSGRVAHAMEGESIKILNASAGAARSQNMSGFTKDRWSGAEHLWWTGAAPGAKLTLALSAKSAGPHEIFAVMTKARDYGVIQLYLNDQKIGEPIDLFNAPDVITTGILSLGTHAMVAGENRLTIEIVGANKNAVKSYMVGLDYVYVAPVSPAQ